MLNISAVHSDSLGVVIMGVRFVVQWWYLGRNCHKTVLYSVTSILQMMLVVYILFYFIYLFICLFLCAYLSLAILMARDKYVMR